MPLVSSQIPPILPPFADFNGDGYHDLAIGIPGEDVGEVEEAGAAHVLFGSANGLTGDADQRWDQNTPGVAGTIEERDRLGGALASGDFNGDGFSDLAIGAPDEDVGEIDNAGAVNILYGSSNGLTSANNQRWDQDSDGVADGAAEGENMGRAIAVGDFNADGFDDLAIGVPDENVDGQSNAGAVNILIGSANGITSAGDQLWTQNSPGIDDGAERNDRFGRSLFSADFNADGYFDLAVGVPEENIGDDSNAGAVHVIYGASGGLSAQGSQFWHQSIGSVAESTDDEDRFGRSLAAGDFNRDGFADLAVGAPGEDVDDDRDAGVVHVLLGSGGGLSDVGNQLWHQSVDGVDDSASSGDEFGHALVAADFDGNGFSDLAIGVPGENINDDSDAGGVNVLYGSVAGLIEDDDDFWSQADDDIFGSAEDGDQFGRALAAGDYDGNGTADLAIGAPFEDGKDAVDSGAVSIIYSDANGLDDDENERWDQDAPGVIGRVETGDYFGRALR